MEFLFLLSSYISLLSLWDRLTVRTPSQARHSLGGIETCTNFWRLDRFMRKFYVKSRSGQNGPSFLNGCQRDFHDQNKIIMLKIL